MTGFLKLPLMGLLLVVSSMSQDTEEVPSIVQNNEDNVEETGAPNWDSPKTNKIEKSTYEYPTMASAKCDESNNCSQPNIFDVNLTNTTPNDDVTKDCTEIANENSKLINDSLVPENIRSNFEPLNRDLFSNYQVSFENDSKDDEVIDKSYLYPVDKDEQSSDVHSGSSFSNESAVFTIPKEQDEHMIEFKQDNIERDGNDTNTEVGPQVNDSSNDLRVIESRSSSDSTVTSYPIEQPKSNLFAEDKSSNFTNYSKLDDTNDTAMNDSTDDSLSTRFLGLRALRPSIEYGSVASRSLPMVENIAKFLSAIIKPTDPFAILSDVLPKRKPKSNVLDAIEDRDDGPIVYPFCEHPPCVYLRCPEPCTCPKFCHKSSKPSCKCCPKCQNPE